MLQQYIHRNEDWFNMNLSANKCKLPELHIGNKTARLPIIQGG